MRKLTRYLRSFRKEVILGPFFKLLEAVFELIVPLLMAAIIDKGIGGNDPAYIYRMGGMIVLLGMAGMACSFTCQYLAARASQGMGTLLRNDLFAHINSLSHAEIDLLGTPSLITRLTTDINQIQLAVAMLIRLVGRVPFLALGATVMAMSLDLRLSLVFWAAVPLVGGVLYLIMSRSVPFYKVIQKKLDHLALIARENLEGVRVIRAFSKQEAETGRFTAAGDDHTRTAVAVGKISAMLNPATYIILNFAVIAILWFGGFRVESGALSQGQIIAFVNYLSQILLALIVLAMLVVVFTRASASIARVNEVFDITSSITESGGPMPAAVPGTPRVEFKGLSFAYNQGGEYALKNLSVQISAGETVGIIGGTGAGKTTLVQLIPRFYDATEGSVLVDGVDVREFPPTLLRQRMGIIPQRAALFSGTVAQNLRWRCPDATQGQLEAAARIAQADEFIQKLPEGYESRILQGGKNLSGGQRQRLTIARALVGGPDILILDDSASALDFATDAALRRALRQDTRGMTVFIVSQRASSIKHADKIIVLDEGQVAGIGTHRQLFESCEVYRAICLSQLSDEEAAKA